MGGIWLVVPLIAGVAGVFLFFMGAGHLFRGRPVTGGGHFLVGMPLAVGGFALALLGFNTQTYARLTHEGPVAEVTVKAIEPGSNRFDVTVHRLDGAGARALGEREDAVDERPADLGREAPIVAGAEALIVVERTAQAIDVARVRRACGREGAVQVVESQHVVVDMRHPLPRDRRPAIADVDARKLEPP